MGFFLMIRRPPRPTQSGSSAASDVYKRQPVTNGLNMETTDAHQLWLSDSPGGDTLSSLGIIKTNQRPPYNLSPSTKISGGSLFDTVIAPVSYTHLRAHETPEHHVCRLLLEKKTTPTHHRCTPRPDRQYIYYITSPLIITHDSS